MTARTIAQRFSRRLIPIDVGNIVNVAKMAVEEALEFLSNTYVGDETLGGYFKPDTVLSAQNLSLKNVVGKNLEIRVQVRMGGVSINGTTMEGFYSPSKALIVIYLSPWLTSEDLVSRKWDIVNKAKSALFHEITHALDVVKGPNNNEGESYYNSPHELRAFTRQIIDDASKYQKGLALKARVSKIPMPKGAALVEILLENSPTWKEISKELTKNSPKYVRQVLVRELGI